MVQSLELGMNQGSWGYALEVGWDTLPPHRVSRSHTGLGMPT